MSEAPADARARELEQMQAATLNILEDFYAERGRMGDVQKALHNILEDFEKEKHDIRDTQRATMNILEDLEVGRELERINEELRKEVSERKIIQENLEKTTQELAASNRALEAFCYSVSHDLRTPLRTIASYTQILRNEIQDKVDAEKRGYLNSIEDAGKHMARLIDNLLELSRITRRDVKGEAVNLSALAGSVVNDLRRIQPDRRVYFRNTPGLTVNGDPDLLRLLLQNLLENAWKFTSNRTEAIIEFGLCAKDRRRVFVVRDNGAGFDMAYASKLFGVFQRLHAQDEFPGTGVGLATAQRIVHRHRGDIWAEGKVDEGAAVYFTLPAAG